MSIVGYAVDDLQVKVIAQFLMSNQTVTGVHLQYNNIGSYGARMIADAFMYNKTVRRIDLSNWR